jgi:hypothetical protein
MMHLMTGKPLMQPLEEMDALEERIAAARTECEIWASSDVEQKAYLDYPDEVLAQLDWVVASPRSRRARAFSPPATSTAFCSVRRTTLGDGIVVFLPPRNGRAEGDGEQSLSPLQNGKES